MAWNDLLEIKKEARLIAKEDREAPLLECPNDGTPLEFRNGVANCPMGDYRTTRTTREP